MFDSGVGREAVEASERSLAALCSAFDPELLSGPDVAAVHASLARMAKLVDGALLLVARRVESSGTWRSGGHRSAAEQLASVQGRSTGSALAALATSRKLAGLAETTEALRSGVLSGEQAEAVADAASADPDAEAHLLRRAGRDSLPELREACRRTKAAADVDREATYRRLRAARCLRRSSDSSGGYHLHLATTADDGARIDAALAPVLDRHVAEARRGGRREPVEAYAADALVELVTAPPKGERRTRAAESKVIALVDVEALRRGSTQGQERCELAGVGPVPVSTVRAMLTDAFLALVVTDGVDVFSVAHTGRQVTAHQRTALEARGLRCEVP
ncbi:MAG: DUF222 domain-containing protein, partial [Acidimicrobiia bacterium]|nr:DUF222 domain-containing protein [Acidimicrobiia bacterium]